MPKGLFLALLGVHHLGESRAGPQVRYLYWLLLITISSIPTSRTRYVPYLCDCKIFLTRSTNGAVYAQVAE
jgi:hypothetical protein